MATTFNGRRKVRKSFGSIREVTEMPNLIAVQRPLTISFCSSTRPKGGRADEGLQSAVQAVFPITDFSNTASLEFVKYEFEQPKYDIDECRARDITFAAPLKVTLRLIGSKWTKKLAPSPSRTSRSRTCSWATCRS